jgi:hypothetical protein
MRHNDIKTAFIATSLCFFSAYSANALEIKEIGNFKIGDGEGYAEMLPITFWLPASSSQKLLMIGSLLLILITELLNSSIEAAIDRISFEKHGLSKRAKDYGSAAVLLSLIFSAIVYLTVIYEIMF